MATTDLIRKIATNANPTKIEEDFKAGDTINVHMKIKEGDKERIQAFKGVVIKVQGRGTARAFTVRKVSGGIGVERTIPFSSPALDKVEVLATGKVRRSRLFYLRKLSGRAARIESEQVMKK